MTVRHDCDQSEHVFLQNITLTCWLTLSLCIYFSILSLLLFHFLIEIKTIFTIKCLTNVLKHLCHSYSKLTTLVIKISHDICVFSL